jgi:hypothetical protein
MRRNATVATNAERPICVRNEFGIIANTKVSVY